MTDVLRVSARELGDPVALRVLVKACDDRRAHRLIHAVSIIGENSTPGREPYVSSPR